MKATKQAITVEDVLNIFYAREFAYDILRRFFVEEPSREYMKEFIQKNMIDLFPFREDSEGIESAVNDIKSYLVEYNPGKMNKHFEALHWDYTRMFIGPYQTLASPWESVHVRKDQLLFQDTTMDVRRLYKKYGYQAADFNIEADDHIGLELDFMYHLNQLCIKSGEENTNKSIPEMIYLLNEQQLFIEKHLAKFVPKLTGDVLEHANTDFYKGMANLLQHYLIIDSNVLNELMNIEMVQN